MPKKCKYTKAKLKKSVNEYINSISRTVQASVTDVDADGKPFKKKLFNDFGEPILIRNFIVPPTISGLCKFLKIDRKTWENYCNNELHPEFFEIVKDTKNILETYLEEQLLSRANVKGIMFNLQNNYGWREKHDLELGEETRKIPSGLSVCEKIAFINSVAKNGVQTDDAIENFK